MRFKKGDKVWLPKERGIQYFPPTIPRGNVVWAVWPIAKVAVHDLGYRYYFQWNMINRRPKEINHE